MTDRELLELAAKAAGIEHAKWNEVHGYMMVGLGGETREWSPLTDDGDALRLAVKLGLSVVQRHTFFDDRPVAVAAAKCPDDYDDTETDYDGDPYAATRRAIVRAAASIPAKIPQD